MQGRGASGHVSGSTCKRGRGSERPGQRQNMQAGEGGQVGSGYGSGSTCKQGRGDERTAATAVAAGRQQLGRRQQQATTAAAASGE